MKVGADVVSSSSSWKTCHSPFSSLSCAPTRDSDGSAECQTNKLAIRNAKATTMKTDDESPCFRLIFRTFSQMESLELANNPSTRM